MTEAVCNIVFLLHEAKKGFNNLSKGSEAEETENVAKAGGKGKVGVIRTNGKISTIFPDASSQP